MKFVDSRLHTRTICAAVCKLQGAAVKLLECFLILLKSSVVLRSVQILLKSNVTPSRRVPVRTGNAAANRVLDCHIVSYDIISYQVWCW